jgi:4a-hydroxytetrahydrobiopterin dehydratase
MSQQLSDSEIEQRLAGGRWRREGDRLVRDYQLADFAAAIAHVNRIAEQAELQGHHPDLLIHGWNKLRVELSTHSAGAITNADLELAERIDALD